MADFENPPLLRDVDSPVGQAANPRALEITVTGGRQIYPPFEGAVGPTNRLLIFAGTVQFDQDGDHGEDPSNPPGEEGEVDEGEHRTLELKLRDPESADGLTASASIAALGSIYLQGNHGGVDVLDDMFGTAVANAQTQDFRSDLYLFSDIVAEQGSQMNRMPYHVVALTGAGKPVGKRRHRRHRSHDRIAPYEETEV